MHELGFGLLPKSYVFKGTKEVTKDQILEQMCFFAAKTKPTTGVIAGSRDGLSAESIARFLLPASECEFVLNSVRTLFYLHRSMISLSRDLDNTLGLLIHYFLFSQL